MHDRDRSRLTFKLVYALEHPDRIVGYTRRRCRDAWLALRSTDHVAYYRAVMRSDAARSREGAVGSKTHESWLQIGQLQFDYLLGHGLKPDMRMLEIGCGNLRAGRLFIDYLDAGNYYGIDISPDILLAAEGVVGQYGLQAKLPHLALVRDLRLEFLPDGQFDVVHAHSVFSHSPIEVIDECLAHVGRVHGAGRVLRLHLRPDRRRRAPGPAGRLLLPDADADRPGGAARPRGDFHGRLGDTAA